MHKPSPGTRRVAIYARYSSQLQEPTSIEDQIRLCRQQAEAHGHRIVRVHIDRSTTATTRHSRPGLRDLLHDAERRVIDFVYAEALDRLSRDQEDMPGIYKRLKYWNVRLFTLQEGEIQPIDIFVGGFVNHAWIENLANKTRRGQVGAVHAGRIAGGLSYGYRMANRIDGNGRPVRGLREVDPHQASVVRRIFKLYADGTSVREIAGVLNREGVPGPRSRVWGQSTINGHRTQRNGILNNELYRGRLVYGRHYYVRNPDTGKRQARPADWDPTEHGTPISAAHLALASANYSAGLLQYVSRLGVPLDRDTRRGFVQIWRYVATLLGIPEALLFDGDEARILLFREIAERSEPGSDADAIAVTNSVVRVLPDLLGQTDPRARAATVRRTYRLTRALLGRKTADLLKFPNHRIPYSLRLRRATQRLRAIRHRLHPPSRSAARSRHLALLLEFAVLPHLSYRLPPIAPIRGDTAHRPPE